MDHAAVGGVAGTADVAGAFQPVQAGGDGTGGQIEAFAQATGGHGPAPVVAVQDRDQRLHVGVVQLLALREILRDAVELAVHPAQLHGEGVQPGRGLVLEVVGHPSIVNNLDY